MGKKKVPPVGKVVKGHGDGFGVVSYGIVGRIGRRLWGKKTGWGEHGGVDTGARTKRDR
jgi:hypothetical protein